LRIPLTTGVLRGRLSFSSVSLAGSSSSYTKPERPPVTLPYTKVD